MRGWLTAAGVLAAVTFALLALLWLGQRRLIYLPSQVVPDTRPAGVEEVTLTTDDGLDLAAWWVGAERPPDDDTEPPVGAAIVVFHGNGGNRVGRLPLARALADRGHDVLLVDYRGYGANPGSPSAHGLALDARAARAWLVDHGTDPDRIVYLGGSLGTGVAIELATAQRPAAMVLRSPFTSLVDLAHEHYPVVPGFLLRDRWPNLDRIRDLETPTLFIAGQADEIVPASQTQTLFDAATEPKHLLVVDDANHNDSDLLHGKDVVDTIDSFLATHLADDPPR